MKISADYLFFIALLIAFLPCSGCLWYSIKTGERLGQLGLKVRRPISLRHVNPHQVEDLYGEQIGADSQLRYLRQQYVKWQKLCIRALLASFLFLAFSVSALMMLGG